MNLGWRFHHPELSRVSGPLIQLPITQQIAARQIDKFKLQLVDIGNLVAEAFATFFFTRIKVRTIAFECVAKFGNPKGNQRH